MTDPWEAVPHQDAVVEVLRRAAPEALRRAGQPAADGREQPTRDRADDGSGHAWAFLGPPGVGQREAARALTAALNCPTPPAGVACGTCAACRQACAGQHDGYHEFTVDGAMYRVEDVRGGWLHTAFLTAGAGVWKVLRIRDADRMNEAAANAFLKGLEEPPRETVWILEIADTEELPETILSRCRVVRFSPWSLAALEERARQEGIAEEDVAVAARVASGAPQVLARLGRPGGMDDLRAHRQILARLREDGPGFALVAARQIDQEVDRATAAIVRDKAEELQELARGLGVVVVVPAEDDKRVSAAERRKLNALAGTEVALAARPRREVEPKAVQALVQFYSQALPPADLKRLTATYDRRQREAKTRTAQAALDDLVGWLRDVLLVGAGGDPRGALHLDAAEALSADADALGTRHCLEAIDVLLATRESLERNVQQSLALESCFMQLSALSLAAASR